VSVAVLGAGAFGRALALTLARKGPVTLWGRRRPGPEAGVTCTDDLAQAAADTLLLALPMQALAGFLAAQGAALDGRVLVACCKGIDLATLRGPSAVIAAACPRATVAVLTGPGFAEDLAAGLPTALTLACADEVAGRRLQADLSTPALRLYRTSDVTGAELGGALKNVVAIAAGAVMGAGLGLSARAAIITRGQAEMVRLAAALGGRAETLAGLSGLGDLVLTCTSERSRNTRFGMALGRGEAFDPSVTVEGAATSLAAVRVARAQRVEMPIAATVAALVEGRTTLAQGMADLLSRPLTME
jgi:glycerol-3-phosphate dehydrogenase (NAD(P)+)